MARQINEIIYLVQKRYGRKVVSYKTLNLEGAEYDQMRHGGGADPSTVFYSDLLQFFANANEQYGDYDNEGKYIMTRDFGDISSVTQVVCSFEDCIFQALGEAGAFVAFKFIGYQFILAD